MTAPEHWDEFLENIATRLKINGQPKNIFVTRFTWKNCNISNKKFLEGLGSNEIKALHPDIYCLSLENYNKCIGQAYDIFENDKENGCLELVNQGNRKRDFLLEWLKDQYGQWFEEQKSKFADSSRHQPTNHDWHEVCCKRLNHWKKRNVDLVIGNNRLDFDNIDRTFVPLGFLEKVKRENSQSKNADQLGKQRAEGYEITQRYERQQDFLDVIIRDGLPEGNSKKQGQRLAIIGEAGSGKTTLLLQIGYELLKKPNNLVIWISLKEVRDKKKTIWDYILEEWFKGSATAKNEWKKELDNKLKDGCVWLLLDGIEDISDRAYSIIGQFDHWLSKPKIASTCRKNRWDSDKADFASFDYDIYECIGYNSDQPSNFIDDWFGDDLESASRLKSELQQATRHRINDLIKYPLHLSLLCSIYEESESNFDFATNKAELFDQFIKRQYKRKITVDRFDADLVKSLGELAIKAIDTQSQLTNAEVKKKLGDKLDKTLELGWLKPIDEYEQGYDFLHDSFKEYFAALAINALAIDAWDFFLPSDHINKPVKGKSYRIFEPVWNSVVLLWSGISRNPNTNNQSRLLIEKLIVFDDGCAKSNDYNNLGHFIALDIAFESNNIVLFDNILDQIIEWAFGTFNQYSQKREWHSISELALQTLSNISSKIVIDKVAKLLANIDSEEIIIDICDFLLHLNTEDSCTISFKYLLKLAIKSPFNQNIVMPLQLINVCGNIFVKDPDLIKLFTEFIFKLDLDSRYFVFGNIEDPILSKLIYNSNCNKSIYLLENLFIKNPDKLIITLESFKWMDFHFSRYISSFKSNISLSNSIKSKTSKNLKIELEHSKILEEFNPELCLESDTKETEIKLIHKPREQIISHVANLPIYLKNHNGSKNYSHSDSFNTILQILKKDKIVDIDPTTSIEIDYEDTTHEELFEIALKSLNSTIEYENQEFDYSYCYLLLCNCAKNLSYERFYQVWHSSNDVIYNLETQFVSCEDIQKELDRSADHPKRRCFVIDIRHLEQESDPNVIAEEIAIKVFNSLGRKTPGIPRVSSLKRELLNLKLEPEFEKLAIALYGKSANEAIAQLCQSLTESIHICPFTGEKTTQQLTNEVKAWLRRINLEYN